ncbi:MAG: hypothetical protein PHX18_03670 [Candidatus Gastranaerophilales bacterium]|nr:hypothetical protein [Candidatus Gastranaerophilales bacterium]
MTEVSAIAAQAAAKEVVKQQNATNPNNTNPNNDGLIGGLFGVVNGLLGNVFGTLGTVTNGVSGVVSPVLSLVNQQSNGGGVFGYGYGNSYGYFPNFTGTAISPFEGMCYTGGGGANMSGMLNYMSGTFNSYAPGGIAAFGQFLNNVAPGVQPVANQFANSNGQVDMGYADILSKLTPDNLKRLQGLEAQIKALASKSDKTDTDKAEMKKLVSELKSLEKGVYGTDTDEELPSAIFKDKDGKSYIYSNLDEKELKQIQSNKANLQTKIDELKQKQESFVKLQEKIQSYINQRQNVPAMTQTAYAALQSEGTKLQKEIAELAAKNNEYIPNAFKDSKTAEYKKASSTSSSEGDGYEVEDSKETGKKKNAGETKNAPKKGSAEISAQKVLDKLGEQGTEDLNADEAIVEKIILSMHSSNEPDITSLMKESGTLRAPSRVVEAIQKYLKANPDTKLNTNQLNILKAITNSLLPAGQDFETNIKNSNSNVKTAWSGITTRAENQAKKEVKSEKSEQDPSAKKPAENTSEKLQSKINTILDQKTKAGALDCAKILQDLQKLLDDGNIAVADKLKIKEQMAEVQKLKEKTDGENQLETAKATRDGRRLITAMNDGRWYFAGMGGTDGTTVDAIVTENKLADGSLARIVAYLDKAYLNGDSFMKKTTIDSWIEGDFSGAKKTELLGLVERAREEAYQKGYITKEEYEKMIKAPR